MSRGVLKGFLVNSQICNFSHEFRIILRKTVNRYLQNKQQFIVYIFKYFLFNFLLTRLTKVGLVVVVDLLTKTINQSFNKEKKLWNFEIKQWN